MAERPEVDIVCAYLECVGEPCRFVRVADEATRSGTPVLVVKVGQSELAEAATLSHTGSLTGSDTARDAAFEQSGAERVPGVVNLLSPPRTPRSIRRHLTEYASPRPAADSLVSWPTWPPTATSHYPISRARLSGDWLRWRTP